MGCPVGVGPEIICKYFNKTHNNKSIVSVVIGDRDVLKRCRDELKLDIEPIQWSLGQDIQSGQIPVFNVTKLNAKQLQWGSPNHETGQASGNYVVRGVELIQQGHLDGIVTCPLSKDSLNQGGFHFPGHTEMLAHLTGSTHYAMMLTGEKLRVTLVTTHCPIREIPSKLSKQKIVELIEITHSALITDFALREPKIAVAGLNPHSGEDGLFGNEEDLIIKPAIAETRGKNIDVYGPFPPDTIFIKAVAGEYDAVVCMYHDQGLIPFKLIHFSDGVNVTLGLPIVRTSVDHGTAYDISGKGVADPTSLTCAVNLAHTIIINRSDKITHTVE